MKTKQTLFEGTPEDYSPYGEYCKPLVEKKLQALKLNRNYHKALGQYLYYIDENRQEQQVLDLIGGFGSTILGHNHKSVKSYIKSCLDLDTPIHTQASIQNSAGNLGKFLNQVIAAEPIAKKRNYIVHQANTGTEAVEAALKHALMAWKNRQEKLLSTLGYGIAKMRSDNLTRHDENSAVQIEKLGHVRSQIENLSPIIFSLKNGFHGKTAGSLSVTSNPNFKTMYDTSPLKSLEIEINCSAYELESIFEKYDYKAFGQVFSPVIGFIFELIQGEGGVNVLNNEFVSAIKNSCNKRMIPLIVDEIQSGIYRTGKFLACSHYNLSPSYITLGKSLGGGMSKIAAFLVDKNEYVPEFGMVHTSTFAEDSLTSEIALYCQTLLFNNRNKIAQKAADCENYLKSEIDRISNLYPGVIKEVRGIGFFIAVEFHDSFSNFRAPFFEAVAASGYLGYMLSSYLLDRHQIRVTTTLSNPNSLRIQPGCYVTIRELKHLISSIEDMCGKIHLGHHLSIISHFFADGGKYKNSKVSSLIPKKMCPNDYVRSVAFACHFIDQNHIKQFDPSFDLMSDRDLDYLMEVLIPLIDNYVVHEQVIEDVFGTKVLLKLYGFGYHSEMFKIEPSKSNAVKKIRNLIQSAKDDGVSHVGLGQFTSIATFNGLLSDDMHIFTTTGNSLTTGLALEALYRTIESKGISLDKIHAAVVGACGNIGTTIASILGDSVAEMTLVHHESIGTSSKFQDTAKYLKENTKIDPTMMDFTSNIADIETADIIVLATSATKSLNIINHIKKNAIVLDVSVPRNIHDHELLNRPDISYFQGGLAKLPNDQKFDCPFLPADDGEIFACMAETLLTSLSNHQGHFSLGPLQKGRVTEIVALSYKHGLSLGKLKSVDSIK